MELAILDVNSEDIQRKIAVENVGAIANPAWSPDGSRIAFSEMSARSSDLFVLELATDQVTRLTEDKFGDIQPTWSPDGRTLAFSTDRGPKTNFETLVFGPMNIAIIDVGTREIRVLSLFEGAKHINPQYSPDGRELYFVSDHEGFSDLYRIELATNAIYQITRLATGVSGITALSPSMSVAQRSGRVLFSVFENTATTFTVSMPTRRAASVSSSRRSPPRSPPSCCPRLKHSAAVWSRNT